MSDKKDLEKIKDTVEQDRRIRTRQMLAARVMEIDDEVRRSRGGLKLTINAIDFHNSIARDLEKQRVAAIWLNDQLEAERDELLKKLGLAQDKRDDSPVSMETRDEKERRDD